MKDNISPSEVKSDNELIAEFMGHGFIIKYTDCERLGYREPFGKRWGHEPFNYGERWDYIMPVIEKIHLSKQFTPYYTNDPRGVQIEIKPNYCHIHIPDTSEGYDYVNGSYEADPLFSSINSKLEGGTIQCVYNSVVEYIKWYKSQNQ